MGKRWRLNRIAMGVILLVLALYGTVQAGFHPLDHIGGQMAEILLGQSEKMYLPGASCAERKMDISVQSLLAGGIRLLAPIGSYVDSQETEETDVEDDATYRLILARQAGDENEVGADGTLEPERQPLPLQPFPS